MARFGFCGPTYQSESVSVDAQRCINWYPETVESSDGKSAVALYPTPGLTSFAAPGGSPVRALFTINGRLFAVVGTTLYELLNNGNANKLGTVASDGLPASIVGGPNQLLIVSAGVAYSFNLTTGIFAAVVGMLGTPSLPGYSDGFFLMLLAGSNQWQVSKLLDATSWDPTLTAKVSVFPDNVVSMLIDHREIWIFGNKASVVYFNSGNVFPYDVIPGGFIEQGSIARLSPCKLDNSIFWLGGDERGDVIAWRANGYTPLRVSNHAVENAWAQYSKVSDAVSYSYQDRGHTFWVLYFPTPSATWVYDAATNLWHERSFLKPASGVLTAHRSQNHAFAFGKHLVGDWNSGNVYQMDKSILDDAGNPLQRLRRAPYVTSEEEWIFHHQLQVLFEMGLGPQPPLLDGSGNSHDPQAMLRWSDDGGHTWSNQHAMDCGQAGQFAKRAIWRRLGKSRGRVYELTCSDPIAWRVVDAYLKATPGFQSEERLLSKFRKVT